MAESPRARASARPRKDDGPLVRSATKAPPRAAETTSVELTADLYRTWRADALRRADEIRRRTALAQGELEEEQRRERAVLARGAHATDDLDAAIAAHTEELHSALRSLHEQQGVLGGATQQLRDVEALEKQDLERFAGLVAAVRERLRLRKTDLEHFSSRCQTEARESDLQQHRLEVEVRQLLLLKEQLDASASDDGSSMAQTMDARRAALEQPLVEGVEQATRAREREEKQLQRVCDQLVKDRALVGTLLQGVAVVRAEVTTMEAEDEAGSKEMAQLRERFPAEVEGAFAQYASETRSAEALALARPLVAQLREARGSIERLQQELRAHQRSCEKAVTRHDASPARQTQQEDEDAEAPPPHVLLAHHRKLVADEERQLLETWTAQLAKLEASIGGLQVNMGEVQGQLQALMVEENDDGARDDEVHHCRAMLEAKQAQLTTLQRRLVGLQEEREATMSVIAAWKQNQAKAKRSQARRQAVEPSPGADAAADQRAAQLLSRLREAKEAEARAYDALQELGVAHPLQLALTAPPGAPQGSASASVSVSGSVSAQEREELEREYGHRLAARLVEQRQREALHQRCADAEAARLRTWELLRAFDHHRERLAPLNERLDGLLGKLREAHRVAQERHAEKQEQIEFVQLRREKESRAQEHWMMAVNDSQSRLAENQCNLRGSLQELRREAAEVQAHVEELQARIAAAQQSDYRRANSTVDQQVAVREDCEALQAELDELLREEAARRDASRATLAPMRRQQQDLKDGIASLSRRQNTLRAEIARAEEQRQAAVDRVQQELKHCRKLQWEFSNSVARNGRELAELQAEMDRAEASLSSSSSPSSPSSPAVVGAGPGSGSAGEEEEAPMPTLVQVADLDWAPPNRPIARWSAQDVTQLCWLVDFLHAGGPMHIVRGARQATSKARAQLVHATLSRNNQRIEFREPGVARVLAFIAVDKLLRVERAKKSGFLALSDVAAVAAAEGNAVFSIHIDGGDCEDILAESAGQRRLWLTALETLVTLRRHKSLGRLGFVMRQARASS